MHSHSRLLIVPALLSGMVCTMPLLAQVAFTENFRSPSTPGTDGVTPCTAGSGAGTYQFPVGWLLRNVDNGTPAANVAYI